METANRNEVISRLCEALPGRNLYDLAEAHGITVHCGDKINKGWVGQTIEKVAHVYGGNLQAPDGYDFELKSTTLLPQGETWRPKETIKVTQMSPETLIREEFETSALWKKLSRLIFVGCYHPTPRHGQVVMVGAIDITDPEIMRPIRAFWEDVRLSLSLGEFADNYNRGTSEDLIQLRPIGTSQNFSTCPITGRKFPSRAFYATKRLIQRIWGL